jgi:outer membrane protein OmpA-like peptidoglycan-associated protein
MKKILMISLLGSLAGCVSSPPAPAGPATPVFFQSFSSALDESALTAITAAAKAASQQPNAQVTVTGAADSVGSVLANKYLSETRAQVVADALVSDGVSADRIHIHGVGIASAPGAAGTPAQSARRVLIQLDQ